MSNAVIARGNASITINDRETQALLVFTPDSEGDGWDAAAVNKLASEKELGACPDPKALETFLAKAARAKTSSAMEMIFARGIEPEDSTGEKISWEALPVPNDMIPFQGETLGKAKAPLIFKTRVERIKHEKKVTKPGALPFMAGKEEVAVTWEKKEIRDAVTVNPKVLQVKYADRGKKIGTVTPSVPGKPGKSIFGRPVPPKGAEDTEYLFGKGIVRDKNELTAAISGFLRIGENWADMVPLSAHAYGINTGADGVTIFLRFEPGDARFTPPTGEEILAEAAAKGAEQGSLISAGELNEVIAAAVKDQEALAAFSLFRIQEAEARVDINEDKTRAVLFLRKGVAGALPLEMKSISQAIQRSGVRGFSTEQLKAAIQTFMTGNDLELSGYVLAEGNPSTRGRDREIEVSADLLSQEEQKPVFARLKNWYNRKISAGVEFDPGKATGLAFVEKNAVVARVSPASEGEAGKDIYGNVIPGLPGNDPDIKLYNGLVLHGSDIVASRDGLLLLEAADKSFSGEVIGYRDAKIDVTVSEDAMEARGDFFREKGAGIPLTVENVKKILADLEIKKGIDWEGVEKACVLARTRGSVSGCVLARGKPPIAAGGSAVKWLVPLNLPELEAEASGDTAQNAGIQIKAGTPVVELSEPDAAGRPGYDVNGNNIPIDMGTALKIEHDDSIREVPRGKGKRLVAVRSGELMFDGRELKVRSVKSISGDAGPGTGNIKFSGEVRISGDVLPGCVVIGGSHVVVDGGAESALVSAGGKVAIARGFKGAGKGIIRARAGIESAFVERASVMAVGDIHLKKGSILSQIKTNGKLYILDGNGKLSGGVCQARMGIDTVDMGSEKGLRTEISFGQDYLIKDQIDACEEEIAKLMRELSVIGKKIQDCLANKIPLPADVPIEKVRLVKLLEQNNLKVFALREKFEEHFDSEIRVRGTVFPGVVIESHNRYYEVKQKRSRVLFYFDRKNGRIKESPLG